MESNGKNSHDLKQNKDITAISDCNIGEDLSEINKGEKTIAIYGVAEYDS